jgi:hypothetical protein
MNAIVQRETEADKTGPVSSFRLRREQIHSHVLGQKLCDELAFDAIS